MAIDQVLNLDKLLASNSLKNRIYRVGIELEGGWVAPPPNLNIEHDGSVVGIYGKPGEVLRIGEVPSPPKIPAAVPAWIRKYYPTYMNASCGLHVHMSFPSARWYQMLMAKEYQDTLLTYLARWGKAENIPASHALWLRLAGTSEYCSHNFWPDAQACQTRKIYDRRVAGNRYTVVNYCFAKENNRTFEVRVLPMFESAELAIRAVQTVLDVTNASLLALAKREAPVKENFFLDQHSGAYIDHTYEVIA